MAFLEAKSISSLMVELLVRSLVLPRTVLRVPGPEFSGPNGSVITIRVPQSRTIREQLLPGDPITFTALAETSVDLAVKSLYDAAHVSDQDLTMTIESFGRQVLAPMAATVALGAEDQLATEINAVAATQSFALSGSPDDTKSVILAAREALVANGVPAGGRWLAVSPPIATRLFKVDTFVKANESGSPSALRDAELGSIFGMRVVESSALTDGEASAYHTSAFAFANRPPAIPQGAPNAAISTKDGISMRTLFAFDISNLRDALAVSMFAGAKLIDANRIVKMDTATI
jgi:hypothetical protein